MIRRDTTLPDGSAGWILISQVEHARLSGELAEKWQIAPLVDAGPAVRRELLGAIYHHDDGWSTWERRPKVDAELGRPLDFTEMPIEDSLTIWRGSIEAAETIGPLAAHVVAGHFLFLLQLSAAWEDGDAATREWFAEFKQRQEGWLDEWQNATDDARDDVAADALRVLQMFDVLSLYLCCAERTEPRQFETPTGEPLTLTPTGQQSFSVAPWPISSTEALDLSVNGTRLLAGRYETDAALADAGSDEISLSWRLSVG